MSPKRMALPAVVLLAALAPARAGIHDVTYPSRLNGRDIGIKVYTPPGYESGTQRYPVVYNLHGAGGGSPDRQWDRAGKTIAAAMDSGKVRPMIYVFVDGLGDTFFIDYADGSLKVESMIVKELIPWVDAHYRTIAGKHGRAVDGFSMGGYGCLMLAFRHPELFSAAVSYGAALIEPSANGEKGKARWGPKEHADQYNPRALARANRDAIRTGLRVRMVCGDRDKLYPTNVSFKALCGELQIPVDWVVVPGVAHDTKGLYVRVGLESLKFIEAALDAATQQAAPRQPPAAGLPKLKVSANGRFLVTADGRPFFWLGDTAWGLISKARREDGHDQPAVDKYFAARAAQGFNVLQTVAVRWGRDGWGGDAAQSNADGHAPLVGGDWTRPAEGYWRWVDFVLDRAAAHGVYVALLPTWLNGVPEQHPLIQDPAVAYRYGHFLGRRYGGRANVVWVMGGDPHPAERDVENPKRLAMTRALAEGIADGTAGADAFDGTADYAAANLMTYHPRGGGRSSSALLHAEPWLAFNMIQTTTRFAFANDDTVAQDYARTPPKPTLDAEVAYEASLSLARAEPRDRRTGPAEVRRAAYAAVFAGAFGHTYGHRSFIGWVRKGEVGSHGAHVPWYESLDAPGARQMIHLRRLMESLTPGQYLSRVPDPELIDGDRGGVKGLTSDRLTATRGAAGDYAWIYSAGGRAVHERMDRLAGPRADARWYDPRTGGWHADAAAVPAGPAAAVRTFAPPGGAGGGNDWILVLTRDPAR